MTARVKWLGIGNRIISQEDWEEAGVEGQQTVEWTPRTRFQVKQDDLTDEAIEILKEERLAEALGSGKAFEFSETPTVRGFAKDVVPRNAPDPHAEEAAPAPADDGSGSAGNIGDPKTAGVSGDGSGAATGAGDVGTATTGSAGSTASGAGGGRRAGSSTRGTAGGSTGGSTTT